MTHKELDKNAARRLAIIRHAREVTGNVARTCRYYGISRQVFYTWLRRYEAEGPAVPRQAGCDLAGQAGRAVEDWLRTTASRAARCAGVRTIAPAPGGARRWVTINVPPGVKISTVPVPSRCRSVSSAPPRPGVTE